MRALSRESTAIYGTTTSGGTHSHGTVFRITTSGILSTIYNFCATPNCEDGEYPSALVLAGDGNFYGAASGGGLYGAGLIFKMPAGGKPNPVYNFCSETNCPDGYAPQGSLIQGTDGNFWGQRTKAAPIAPARCSSSVRVAR